MAWQVPVELEEAVLAAARAVVGEAPLATGPLTRAIVDRSRRYTSEREALSAPADRVGDLAARAAFFTIADAMKVAVPLAELAHRHALPHRRPLRVVDLGAGCGAMTLGLLATQTIDLSVTAIDQDAKALAIASRAIAAYASTRRVAVELATRTGDVTSAPIPACDLVLAGSVLNELAPDDRIRVAERALAAVGEDGAVILVEPALRETTRDLHVVRDTLIARGAHVFAPCTRHIAPCPALADPDDWCHEDRALDLPPHTAELARITHLRDSGMKFAYLTLRKAPLDLGGDPDAYRIVAEPRSPKGKLELLGCNRTGWVRIRLLKRHRNAANRPLEKARRGDVVTVDQPEIDAETPVSVEKPGEPSGRTG